MTQADAKSKSIVSDNSELDPNTVSDFQDQEQLQSAVPELRQPLLPGHRLGLCAIQTSYFSGNLRDGAASTTPGRYTIPSEPSVYALLFADLLTILGDKPDIGQRNEEDEGTHKAIISNCFRIFAMNVAWNKIRQKTHFDVVKTSEEASFEFTHFDDDKTALVKLLSEFQCKCPRCGERNFRVRCFYIQQCNNYIPNAGYAQHNPSSYDKMRYGDMGPTYFSI